jgi:hypothetical protein
MKQLPQAKFFSNQRVNGQAFLGSRLVAGSIPLSTQIHELRVVPLIENNSYFVKDSQQMNCHICLSIAFINHLLSGRMTS